MGYLKSKLRPQSHLEQNQKKKKERKRNTTFRDKLNEEACWEFKLPHKDFPLAQLVKNPPAIHEISVQFLSGEDRL